MLILRKEQLEAFEAAQRQAFYRDVLKRTREEQPELCSTRTDDANLALIEWAAEKAPALGLIQRADIERYARFVLQHGQDYEAQESCAWAVAILNDVELIGVQKLDQIDEHPQSS